jgi:hypothetical protein
MEHIAREIFDLEFRLSCLTSGVTAVACGLATLVVLL